MTDEARLDLRSHLPSSRRAWLLRGAAALLAAAGVGAATVWAAIVVFAPAAPAVTERDFAVATTAEGEVGASISLSAQAEWLRTPVASNLASGTVTTVNIEPGSEVGPGTILYSVDLRPVAVAQGAIPAFRPIVAGTRGADVAQLQSMLADLSLYSGPIDGVATFRTVAAVKAWQSKLGIASDGVVQAADVVFVPQLPTRIDLDRDRVYRGATLGGGEPVVVALSSAPVFSISVTSAQAASIDDGFRVEVEGPDGDRWNGSVAGRTVAEDQSTVLQIEGDAGEPLCLTNCASIPLGKPALLSAEVFTVEPKSGVVVPTAAIQSRAGGKLYLVERDGNEIEIIVIQSARGLSLITGAAVGAEVRIPFSSSP